MGALNARAYERLAPVGVAVGILFLLLSAALLAASIGWLRRLRGDGGWAVAIIATQVIGDLVNVFLGSVVRGLTGFIIAAALLCYLLRAQVRSAFGGIPK